MEKGDVLSIGERNVLKSQTFDIDTRVSRWVKFHNANTFDFCSGFSRAVIIGSLRIK